MIYDKTIKKTWTQEIGIYDYIVGKFLLYLNFDKINSYLLENHFSQNQNFKNDVVLYSTLSTNDINTFHNKDDLILKFQVR
jgi:hypothetical protein